MVWLSQIVIRCGSTEFTVEMGQISTHTTHEIYRKLTGKHQSTINKLTNCILWCLCHLVCFHIFILTVDERPAVLPKYYHHRSHQNPTMEAKITLETGWFQESVFHVRDIGSQGMIWSAAVVCLFPAWRVCAYACGHLCIHKCDLPTHVTLVTISSVCLSLAADFPWSLAYSSQDLFPPCCSLQIWTSNSPKQGTTYILYIRDLENKPSNA